MILFTEFTSAQNTKRFCRKIVPRGKTELEIWDNAFCYIMDERLNDGDEGMPERALVWNVISLHMTLWRISGHAETMGALWLGSERPPKALVLKSCSLEWMCWGDRWNL